MAQFSLSVSYDTSNVDIPGLQRIRLEEVPARFHLVAHQRGKDLVRLDSVLDLHLQQAAHGRFHRGFHSCSDSSRPDACNAACRAAFGFIAQPFLREALINSLPQQI